MGSRHAYAQALFPGLRAAATTHIFFEFNDLPAFSCSLSVFLLFRCLLFFPMFHPVTLSFLLFLDLRSLDIAAARAFSLGGSVVGGRHQDIDHNLIEKEARRDSARQIIDTINSESLIQRK